MTEKISITAKKRSIPLTCSSEYENAFTEILSGGSVHANLPPEESAASSGQPFVIFEDPSNGSRIGLNEDVLSKGILISGSPGTGKTNLFNMIISSRLSVQRDDEIIIIADTKGDYLKEFGGRIPEDELIVVGSGEEYADITAYHNMFAEVMSRDSNGRLIYNGAASDEAAAELISGYFKDLKSEIQPVFPSMAKLVCEGIMVAFMRRFGGYADRVNLSENQRGLNNKSFKEYFLKSTTDDIKKEFENGIVKDYRSCVNYISNASNQTQGVMSYIGTVLGRMLTGAFAKADPSREFSMKEIIRGGKRKTVFLEFDLMRADTLSPYYSLLIDQALKYSLGGRTGDAAVKRGAAGYMQPQAKASGRPAVNFFLDEFSLLPGLSHIANALSFGRSQGVRVIAGLQNINALYDIYGQARTKNILAGFQSIFAFAHTDQETRRFITERFGENYQNLTILTHSGNINSQRSGHCVEDWDLMQLQSWQAVASIERSSPFLFTLPLYYSRIG